MKFSDTLVGVDISISDDKLRCSRKNECDAINSKTIVLQSQPITTKNQQSYILDLDMKLVGFGKIGVMTQNPLNIDVCQSTGLKMLKDSITKDQKVMVTEFPLYDIDSKIMVEAPFLTKQRENVQIHLLLLLDSNGSVHYFINFEHKGTLFVNTEIKYSWWLFFDLNGCFKAVTSTNFNGAPDQDLFDDEDGFKAYYSECARCCRLIYQTSVVIMQLSESNDTLYEIFERRIGTTMPTKVRLKAKCDFNSGELVPECWINSDLVNESTKEIEQSFIGRSDMLFSRESTNTTARQNINVSISEKINFFEAEIYADQVIKKMKNKDEENVLQNITHNNEIKFTDLSQQISTFDESIDPQTMPSEDIIPLVDGMIAFFLENYCPNDTNNSCDKCKEEMKEKVAVKKTYSTEFEDKMTIKPSVEVEVELIVYKTIMQLQIMQCIGVRDPGIYIFILDIDSCLLSVNLKTQEELVQKVEEWLWLLYQRGPCQVAPKSLLMVLCYKKSTLDYITSEKTIHNIQLIKKIVTETCLCHEYCSIIKDEPIVLGPLSSNRAEKIHDLKRSVISSIVNSRNIARLVPEKWFRFHNIIKHQTIQDTKIMSFGQACQILKDHCKNDIDHLIKALEYLSNLGLIPWLGDKNCYMMNRPTSPTGSKIMEEQASVIVVDKEWLRNIVLKLEYEEKKNCLSLDKIEEAIKPFLYHKLLFILLLKFPSLAVESAFDHRLLTIFDYPLQSQTSSFSLFSETFHDNQLTIYFIINQPLPWIYYLSLLLACVKMSSNYHLDPFNIALMMEHFELEEKHQLDIYRLSERVIATKISYEIPRKDNSYIISRVRKFIEQHIYHLSSISSHRLTVRAAVRCSCNALCLHHNKPRCIEQYSCLHFLHLDEVLCNHVVYCGPRRIKTSPWREFFPPIIPSCLLHIPRGSIVPAHSTSDYAYKMNDNVSAWMTKVSKILNIDDAEFNWKKLAMKLGYKENIKHFENEQNPAMVLLLDWMTSSGNNQLSMDFLILTLQEAGQYQISDIIEGDPSCQNTQPQIFLSYQWHSQTEAKNIVEYLNRIGFATWMDVGQMGGGDLLMHRIERAIRCCKVMIACITPRYVVSTFCHRELVLANLLKKPIIPIMISSVPWPPPGGTGLLLAPYIYIDMFGVGGHGGSGLKSDLVSRYAELETQVSKFCTPNKIANGIPRHSLIKVNSPQTIPIQIMTDTNGVHHHIQPEVVNTHQSSAFTVHAMPVPSQTSVRECSSICTII